MGKLWLVCLISHLSLGCSILCASDVPSAKEKTSLPRTLTKASSKTTSICSRTPSKKLQKEIPSNTTAKTILKPLSNLTKPLSFSERFSQWCSHESPITSYPLL